MWAGCVRSRAAGHHLRHGRERHLPACAAVRPPSGQAHPEAGHLPAVQSPCRRSRFMQLRTSAPTGHHAAPDIREGLRLPWRMSSSSCSCAHGDKDTVESVPVPVHAGHGRAAVMEEAVIRSRSPAGSCSTPMQPTRKSSRHLDKDIRLRHLDKVTPAPLQHSPCFSSIERDIRQRAGHGAAVCLCLTCLTVPHSPLVPH